MNSNGDAFSILSPSYCTCDSVSAFICSRTFSLTYLPVLHHPTANPLAAPTTPPSPPSPPPPLEREIRTRDGDAPTTPPPHQAPHLLPPPQPLRPGLNSTPPDTRWQTPRLRLQPTHTRRYAPDPWHRRGFLVRHSQRRHRSRDNRCCIRRETSSRRNSNRREELQRSKRRRRVTVSSHHSAREWHRPSDTAATLRHVVRVHGPSRRANLDLGLASATTPPAAEQLFGSAQLSTNRSNRRRRWWWWNEWPSSPKPFVESPTTVFIHRSRSTSTATATYCCHRLTVRGCQHPQRRHRRHSTDDCQLRPIRHGHSRRDGHAEARRRAGEVVG